jgi:acyl dehydratase
MALNPKGLGAETPWTSVVVSQRQIDMLCNCVEDYNPLFLDEETAAASANRGVVAPPTFINCFRDYKTMLLISELGVDMAMLLHGEQIINFFKPVRPGEKVWHRIKIVDMGRKKSKTYKELSTFTVLITLKNDNGEKLVEATQQFFVRDK